MPDLNRRLIDSISAIAASYSIGSLQPLLASARTASEQDVIKVAVLGRFKAGKSSFLNTLLGRDLLPVGVIPVTSVVTEIGYGAEERAAVRFLDAVTLEIPTQDVRFYVSEKENPSNEKRVSVVRVELPELENIRQFEFVDTPGLESVFGHNTEVSRDWLPNVGLALVTIGVDPPLSEHDLALLRTVHNFTPHVAVLLTKIDILNPAEREEVETFVREQLKRNLGHAPRIFPFSVRPGFERLRHELKRELLDPVASRFGEQKQALVTRKVKTLLSECRDYLMLALKSADALDSERADLKTQILGQKESLDQQKLALKVVTKHLAAGTRVTIEKRLRESQRVIESALTTVGFPRESRISRPITLTISDIDSPYS